MRQSRAKRLLDVRLNNISQLSGYAKRDDLKFFLGELCDMEYLHMPDLAPTKNILDAYRKKIISWEAYEDQFVELMAKRNIEHALSKELVEDSCLLCSEHKPHHCHRRLVVEYLNRHWGQSMEVVHLY